MKILARINLQVEFGLLLTHIRTFRNQEKRVHQHHCYATPEIYVKQIKAEGIAASWLRCNVIHLSSPATPRRGLRRLQVLASDGGLHEHRTREDDVVMAVVLSECPACEAAARIFLVWRMDVIDCAAAA